MVERLLTDRQREVLQHRCAGRTTSEVAALCGIAPQTVKEHIRCIRQRLGRQPLNVICRMAARGDAPPTLLGRPVATPPRGHR